MDLRKELLDIKKVLKNNPRGMTVTEISKAVGMNRHSVAKYLEILVISGHVDMKLFGSSKVFYPSRRIPMSAILNFSSDFIVVLNKDLEFITANDRFLDIEGISAKEIAGRGVVSSSFLMRLNPPILTNISDALNGSESSAEASLVKDGERLYFYVRFIPTVFDDADKGVTIILEDVTGRRMAEAALKESEERFRAIFEHAAVGIALVSRDGRFQRVNHRFCDILGYSPEELKSMTYRDITYPMDMDASDKSIRQLKSGTICSYSIEKRYIRRDGSVVWVSLTTSTIRGEDGSIKYYIPIIEDITARKEAETALRMAHEELEEKVKDRTSELSKAYGMVRDILEKAPFGIYVVNDEGGIDYVNPAMLAISGDSEATFRMMNALELPTYRDIGLSDRIRQALDGKYFSLGPVEYESHFGKKRSLRNFIGMPLEEGGKKKALIFVEDLTKYKDMEEELMKNEVWG